MKNKVQSPMDIVFNDLFRLEGSRSYYSLIKNLIKNPIFRFIFVYRMYNSKKILFGKFFFKIIHRHYYYKYALQIPLKTKIGKGFYIGHFGWIVINGNSQIGDNCNITSGVTIGATNRGKYMGSPTIGNKVWIGANSTIVGKIQIGDNVIIAPNCYINRDIPSDSIVIGNPAKILPSLNACKDYINNQV